MFDMLRLKLSISLNPRISSGRPWRFVVSYWAVEVEQQALAALVESLKGRARTAW